MSIQGIVILYQPQRKGEHPYPFRHVKAQAVPSNMTVAASIANNKNPYP
jgi:hypothetical protein